MQVTRDLCGISLRDSTQNILYILAGSRCVVLPESSPASAAIVTTRRSLSYTASESNDDYIGSEKPLIAVVPRACAEDNDVHFHQIQFKQSCSTPKDNLKRKSPRPTPLKDGRIYRHQPIARDQVRLLYIAPGALEDDLHASFMVVDDQRLGDHDHLYVALSYNWGDHEETDSILLHDNPRCLPTELPIKSKGFQSIADASRARKLTIKPNLSDALRHFRDTKLPVAIWVDALCINQLNTEEKEHQLLKMVQIYRKAYNVNIWLGSDDPSHPVSDVAMRFVRDIINPDKHHALLCDAQYIKSWASLFELLRWSWFSRRWVIQEIALARRATVHCGRYACQWSDFQVAISIFRQYFAILKPRLISHFENEAFKEGTYYDESVFEIEPLGANLLVEVTSKIFRIKKDGILESTKSLEMLVCSLSSFDTTDPRDTVYAFRNIAKELNRPHSSLAQSVPIPDYTKDLWQIYREFVKWVVETSGSIDIICRQWALKELNRKRPLTPRLVQLPTWIQYVEDSAFGKGEDLFNGRKAGNSFVGLPESHNYHASGRGIAYRAPKVIFPPEPTFNFTCHGHGMEDESSLYVHKDMALRVWGVAIGKVSFRSDGLADGVITKKVLKRLDPSLDRKAKIVPKVRGQLWQTLVADRGPDGKDPPTWYPTACRHALQKLTRNGHLNIRDILRRRARKVGEQDIVRDYLERVLTVTWQRSFIEGTPMPPQGSHTNASDVDNERLVGFASEKSRKGDVIAVFFGCSVPIILRPVRSDTNGTGGCYEFIGEAYIYGKMDGEVFDEEYEEREFKLI
ncbi:HET-domain-containing protein [Plenodomus tracheiphilus IPT5]|uniref:HET-domain-containing protein n=1 Tax=Plenodomus tracheiphilus IPT5 TaxID=1408161 RepID=A0A6A7AS15_9PLEO|nr:HET-domain-containing protein [Plenodomus tracheiphilus IPT5]